MNADLAGDAKGLIRLGVTTDQAFDRDGQ